MSSLQHVWARTGVLAVLLLPLAMLFAVVSGGRRLAYRRGWLHAESVGVPVIVVGNITAGGSGKTPLVIWLVNWLRSQGYRPGVISRGYGGTARGCVEVQADSPPAQVGDEPVLIRLKTDAPVVVGRDRVAAVALRTPSRRGGAATNDTRPGRPVRFQMSAPRPSSSPPSSPSS